MIAKYSQVDKDGVAVILALKKYHQYLFRRHFQLVVDNKAIVGILHPEKPMSNVATKRLVRWSIMVTAYDYDLCCRESEYHSNVDMRSRLPLKGTVRELSDNKLSNMQVSFLPVTVKDIQEATEKDIILQRVINYSRTIRDRRRKMWSANHTLQSKMN